MKGVRTMSRIDYLEFASENKWYIVPLDRIVRVEWDMTKPEKVVIRIEYDNTKVIETILDGEVAESEPDVIWSFIRDLMTNDQS